MLHPGLPSKTDPTRVHQVRISRPSWHRYSFEIIAALLSLASGASLASEQEQAPPYPVNVPYRCPDGITYTITKRVGQGARETCFWREE
jgi:hypothetical protein